VQGVWYRASTRQEAERRKLSGWARNLPDGRVEVVVAGPAEPVAELCAWLWKGPPNAQVSSVAVFEHIEPVAPGFVTR